MLCKSLKHFNIINFKSWKLYLSPPPGTDSLWRCGEGVPRVNLKSNVTIITRPQFISCSVYTLKSQTDSFTQVAWSREYETRIIYTKKTQLIIFILLLRIELKLLYGEYELYEYTVRRISLRLCNTLTLAKFSWKSLMKVFHWVLPNMCCSMCTTRIRLHIVPLNITN